MRILIDTNILFSALLFPRSKPAKALLYIAQNHEMVLCDRNIAELRDILNLKTPKYLPDAEVLLAEMSYELIPAVDHVEKLIRDAKDQPNPLIPALIFFYTLCMISSISFGVTIYDFVGKCLVFPVTRYVSSCSLRPSITTS